jgi:aconitase A
MKTMSRKFTKSVSDNVKHLNLQSIKRLLDANGITTTNKEYCLEALKASQCEKSGKLADNIETDHIAASGVCMDSTEPTYCPDRFYGHFGREYDKDTSIREDD